MKVRSGIVFALFVGVVGQQALADATFSAQAAQPHPSKEASARGAPLGALAISSGPGRLESDKRARVANASAGVQQSLSPQPLPPKWGTTTPGAAISLNPQPLPPKVGITNAGTARTLNRLP